MDKPEGPQGLSRLRARILLKEAFAEPDRQRLHQVCQERISAARA
ncbi:MAG TPA: hypothetical protein VFC19_04340 [Candidatus Limnocylindrales bacterium]|nr:hypothetical protein [Candidatus Limnocylindrales bacterium]